MNLERAVRLELTNTGFAIRSLGRLATRAHLYFVLCPLFFVVFANESNSSKSSKNKAQSSKCGFVLFGTEGEIRTLEASLEDSHVSSYITSANGTPGRTRTRNLDVRSVALFQLSYRSKEFGHGASYRIRTGVSALATPCLKPTGPTMREECLELCTLIIGLDDACYQRMQSSKHKEQRSFLFFFGRGGQN